MPNSLGVISRGVKAPIIKEGDNLPEIVVNSLLEAAKAHNFTFRDRDVVAVTEAVVARAQGNYVTLSDVADDVREKFPSGEAAVIFPIMSRNRFACLAGIARALSKVYVMLSYPSDEVGNRLITPEQLEDSGVNPYTDVLSEAKFRELFGYEKHIFTGVDYIELYKETVKNSGAEVEIIFANNPTAILNYTKNVIAADIHTRKLTKSRLLKNGAEIVYGLDEIMNKSRGGSGFNPDYGLLGANLASGERLKLFPKDCDVFVADVAAKLFTATGKQIEVMVYGDGAFKDPAGFIWELADPVVSPGYTNGLSGTPNEIKLKYIADNEFPDLSGEELKAAILNKIKTKKADLKGDMASQGTTPRRLPDLLGSLADLTSGSGDKGTPIVFIQGYFENYGS
ncbi:MAG: coenzyme F420-0:L-glutamate ligase [Oscillospiraceae bacterium]|nr:coenzyme F420-0:L-glutamate ligase [Oscillospiraceae bacterium]